MDAAEQISQSDAFIRTVRQERREKQDEHREFRRGVAALTTVLAAKAYLARRSR